MQQTAIVRLRCLLKLMTSNRDLLLFLKNQIISIHNFRSKIIRTLQLSKLLHTILRQLLQFQQIIFLRILKMRNHEDIRICSMLNLLYPTFKLSQLLKTLDILCNLHIMQSQLCMETTPLLKVHQF